jgi:glucosamine-6-phosphate deaminase
MVASVSAGHVSFARSTVFALDEFGGLAPDDPGSTRNTLQRQLVSLVDLPARAFHVLDPEAADSERECRRYDELIGPGFDLALLGIGLNGHVGMNEPCAAEESPTRRVELTETTIHSSARYFQHQDLPHWGLTVGLKTLLASREIWLLASGSAKAEIVRTAVQDGITTRIPASLLRKHQNCSLFVDADAGALL